MAVQLFQHNKRREKKEMNQTSNYGFNVPVGADIVNPLVQDFPNWDSLDTILRNVANTGVTTATHTKAGTIHTLSFSDTTVPMIRFQATADFNVNDTFTVNGLSVSALTVSGESLPAGAFVIGSMVLCELRDNLLTVYTSGTDANTLQGHSASYFATASDLQTVDDKADANRVLIDQINSDLNNVHGYNTVYATAVAVGSTSTTIDFNTASGANLDNSFLLVMQITSNLNTNIHSTVVIPCSLLFTDAFWFANYSNYTGAALEIGTLNIKRGSNASQIIVSNYSDNKKANVDWVRLLWKK